MSLPLPPTPHKIEIAAFVGLQNGLVEQMRVAAPGPFRRRERRQRRAAFFDLGRVDQKIDASFGDVEPDHVAVLHQRQRSEEHTSELQSLAYLVCRLLLEKK